MGVQKLIFFLLICISFLGYAKSGNVYGVVKSQKGPLAFVNVFIEGTSHGVFTDQNGEFVIKSVPYGQYVLRAQLLGYTNYSAPLTVNSISVEVNPVLEESDNQIDEVVVSGTLKSISKSNSPVPVEVYSSEFFKKNPTTSIFESMANINGVRPQLNCNICNTGDIHINGLEGPYTMVLIDGMPIVSGLSTVYGLMGIPQSLINRVEVVKGPSSTLYGSEAVGGIINIITKSPQSAPQFSADVFGSTWGEINSDIGVKFKVKKAYSLVGINHFNYQNKVDNNDDGITDLALQDRISV